MTDNPRVLGEALRSIREAASLSPDDLAQRLKLEPATVLGYESGELELPAHALMAFLQAVDCSFLDLHLRLHPEAARSPRVEVLLGELRDLQPTA
jgi:transcriptional regulator with XRE-family HTH domain